MLTIEELQTLTEEQLQALGYRTILMNEQLTADIKRMIEENQTLLSNIWQTLNFKKNGDILANGTLIPMGNQNPILPEESK